MASVNQRGGSVAPTCRFIITSTDTGGGFSACPIALQLRIDERRSIGRELHDSTAQLLVALQLNVVCLKKKLGAESDGHRLLSEIDQLLTELHREVRTVAAIAPQAPLRGRDLVGALTAMAENFSGLTGVKVAVIRGPCVHLSQAVETNLYRVAQEAVANAVRHGRARHISITIGSDRPGPILVVEDDGVGIPPNSSGGIGLSSIRERVDELSGLLSIQRLQRGTRISVSLVRENSNSTTRF